MRNAHLGRWLLAMCVVIVGCTSTKSSNTARTAVEQLLISSSIDQTLDRVDFTPFANTHVYIEEKYMDAVDKNYIVGSVRHRLMQQGAVLASKREDAEVVMEIRSGAVGTDTSESYLGVPEISLPGMVTLPEVRFVTRSRQTGTAKIGLVAYDARSGEILGDGGVSLARSDDNNWYVLGIGPYQNGTIHKELSKIPTPNLLGKPKEAANPVVFHSAPKSEAAPESSRDVRWASGEEAAP